MLELKGISYISDPRCGKRGGGAAIAVNLRRFTLSKLNIHVPKGVEAVWGLVKPKEVGKIAAIIVCSFYSPPDKNRNIKLIDHITASLQSLLNIHKYAGIIISGDRNNIDINSLLATDPSLKQIVSLPTHGQKILDVICTNLAHFYQTPSILPPLAPDRPDRAAPSDHLGVQAMPITNGHIPVTKKIVKYVRPLPDSAILSFKQKFALVDFELALQHLPVDQMVSTYQKLTNDLVAASFPEKKVIVYEDDKPWYNEKLRELKRQRLREYTKHGKSVKYAQLHRAYIEQKKDAIDKHKEKVKCEVVEGKRGSVYPFIKKLGSRPHSGDKGFQLPSHAAKNLSHQQSAEVIADHFSKISQELPPLTINSLPDYIATVLSSPDLSQVHILDNRSVKKRLIRAKKPSSSVPGDLPRKLVKSCYDEVAIPARATFNSITTQGTYPAEWKVERTPSGNS